MKSSTLLASCIWQRKITEDKQKSVIHRQLMLAFAFYEGNIIVTALDNKKMAIFKLPKDFKSEAINYKYLDDGSEASQMKLEIKTISEKRRLNALGAKISDYLSLIKSANLQVSDFEALSLAIELHKAESLKEIEVTGNVDAGVRGSLSIDDGIYVRGDINTSVSGNVDADVSGSLSIDDGVYVRGEITTS